MLNSFTAIVPADNPQFQVLVMLDEPKALPETHGFITSGWNAVPTGGGVSSALRRWLGSSRASICRRPTALFFGIEVNPVRRSLSAADFRFLHQLLRARIDETSRPVRRWRHGSNTQAEAVGVASLAVDSRAVKPGDLFFALAGHKTDGARFIDAAAESSDAVAVVADQPPQGGTRVPFVARCRRCTGARRSEILSAAAGNHRGCNRNRRQDLGRGLYRARC